MDNPSRARKDVPPYLRFLGLTAQEKETYYQLNDEILAAEIHLFQLKRKAELILRPRRQKFRQIKASLPNELWHGVFRYYVQPDQRFIRRLMLVCRHWYAMVTSSPSLWTQITIRDLYHPFDHHYSRYLDACLTHSRDHLLDVVLDMRLQIEANELCGKAYAFLSKTEPMSLCFHEENCQIREDYKKAAYDTTEHVFTRVSKRLRSLSLHWLPATLFEDEEEIATSIAFVEGTLQKLFNESTKTLEQFSLDFDHPRITFPSVLPKALRSLKIKLGGSFWNVSDPFITNHSITELHMNCLNLTRLNPRWLFTFLGITKLTLVERHDVDELIFYNDPDFIVLPKLLELTLVGYVCEAIILKISAPKLLTLNIKGTPNRKGVLDVSSVNWPQIKTLRLQCFEPSNLFYLENYGTSYLMDLPTLVQVFACPCSVVDVEQEPFEKFCQQEMCRERDDEDYSRFVVIYDSTQRDLEIFNVLEKD